jgi:membrane-bound lytic murein transglycosylase B
MWHGLKVFGLGLALLPMGCGNAGPERVAARPAAVVNAPVPQASPEQRAGFDRWAQGFRGRAVAKGISPGVVDRALAVATYDPDVIRLDRRQAEFARPIWEYLDSAVSDTRRANGAKAMAEHGTKLRQIEARYGVPAEVVAAIWGMETSYGINRGKKGVIPSLATLAYDGRRGAFFEEQLIAALKILQAGDTDPASMKGSWAGAMGHTQFMPTSYLAYAVDFTGDGRRDIWGDDPTDALASAANYLARMGWQTGQPWAVEVTVPAGFREAGKATKKQPSQWQAQGVKAVRGGRIPDHGPASILMPAGANGPALMIFDNFRVISRYNNADSYVMGVGLLSDHLAGRGGLVKGWPRTDRPLTESERKEIQRRLTDLGYYSGEIDGITGSGTMEAVRAWQSAQGLTPDGYVNEALLKRLR